MSAKIHFTTCPSCGKAYTTQEACPACPQSPQIVPKTKAERKSYLLALFKSGNLLSYSQYSELSPNKVSAEEYNRYLYLHRLQENGIISDLELQVKYEVLPRIQIKVPVAWYKNFTQSRVTYSPDFRFRYQGIQVIEEYKALNTGTKKKPLKTPKPLIKTASRKSIKELVCYDEQIQSGDVLFVIVCWDKRHHCYEAFNANSKHMADYPLANHIGIVDKGIAA